MATNFVTIDAEVAREMPYVLTKDNNIYSASQMANLLNGISSDAETDEQSIKNRVRLDLEKLISYERGKEQFYLETICKQYATSDNSDDNNFARELSQAINKSFSVALQMISLYTKGLYKVAGTTNNDTSNIQQNIEQFRNEWNIVGNKILDNLIKDFKAHPEKFVTGDILDESAESLMEKYEEAIKASWGEEILNKYDFLLQPFLNAIKVTAISDKKTEKKGFNEERYKKKFRDWTQEEIDRAFANHKGLPKEQLFSRTASYLEGIVNGLMGEVFQTVNRSNKVGDLLGRSTIDIPAMKSRKKGAPYYKRGTAGKTDAIQIFRFSMPIQYLDMKDLPLPDHLTQQQVEAHAEYWSKSLKKASEEFNDLFVIHYSSKDQSTYTSKGVDFEDDGKWAARLGKLQEIAKLGGMTSENIYDLLFGLVNTGKGMIAEGYTNLLKESISAYTIAFMFEDYQDSYKQLADDKANNRMHVYFISGNYYTVSDLLSYILKYAFDKKEGSNPIKVTLVPPTTDLYETKVKNSNLVGIDRWDKLREETLIEGRLGMGFATNHLLTELDSWLKK